MLRKKIVEETQELTHRLNSELKIVMDLIEATEQGGDCLDPAVTKFQRSCHVVTRNNYFFMYLEQLQAERTGSRKKDPVREPFLF